MKNITIIYVSILLVFSSFFSSCEAIKNTNNTQRGVGIGAVAGGVLGAVLGNNIGKGGNAALGAAIGAAIGGGAGAIIGNKMDKQARQIDEALPSADVERVGEGIRLVLKEDAIRFDINKSTLTSSAKNNLDKLIKVFSEYKDTNIVIYGYTDNTGALEHNLKLSEERANSVKSYLALKGLSSDRFSVTGMGVSDPIATNETADGRAQNRRVEFVITANQKMIEEAKKESNK